MHLKTRLAQVTVGMSRRGVFGAARNVKDQLQEQVSCTQVKNPHSGKCRGYEQVSAYLLIPGLSLFFGRLFLIFSICRKNSGVGDRFIPNRSTTDFEHSMHSMLATRCLHILMELKVSETKLK